MYSTLTKELLESGFPSTCTQAGGNVSVAIKYGEPAAMYMSPLVSQAQMMSQPQLM